MAYVTIFGDMNTFLDEADSSYKFLHALSESMPMCDLKRGVTDISQIQEGDVCNVYCAQSTCDAAKKYIDTHRHTLTKCSTVNYLKNGSLEIDESRLVDGQGCHQAIREWNQKNREH